MKPIVTWVACLVFGYALGGPVAAADATVEPLKTYDLVGDAYHPVGDWTDDHTLLISMVVLPEDGEQVDPGSLHATVAGHTITLGYSISKVPAANKAECTTEAKITYKLSSIRRGDYSVQLVGPHGYPAKPLATLQQAQAQGIPTSFDVTVSNDGTVLLGQRKVSLDDLDLLFLKAEPYQSQITVTSDSAKAMDLSWLAREHALPYYIPNEDALEQKMNAATELAMKEPPAESAAPMGSRTSLPLAMTLSLPSVTALSGYAPKFEIEIRNTGKDAAKLADIRKFTSSFYLMLDLTQDGAKVEGIPVAFSDPAPLSPKDWLVLQPGEAVTATYYGRPMALEKLEPGKYEAQLIFYFDKMMTRRYLESNKMVFEVVP